jgi:hypothetical protein
MERIDLVTPRDEPERVFLSAQSLDTSLVPAKNIHFGGTGSTRYIIIIPAEDRHGIATVLVRGMLGEYETSEEIEVTVLPKNNAPTLASFPVKLEFASGPQRSIPLEISDPDGDDLGVTIVVTPEEFSQFVRVEGSGTDRSVLIVSTPEVSASFDLSVTVCDTGGLCISHTCAVQLVPPVLTVERQGDEFKVFILKRPNRLQEIGERSRTCRR